MKYKRLLFGFLIGGVLLFLTLRQIDLRQCLDIIKNANWQFIFIAMLVYTIAFIIRSIRWQRLIASLGIISYVRLFFFLLLGFFMNNLLPLRLGEIIRAHITGLKTNISRSSILATIIVERLFDGISYIVLFFMTIAFLPFPIWAKRSFLIGSLFFISGIILLFLFSNKPAYLYTLFSLIPLPDNLRTKLISLLNNFLNGLDIFKRPIDLIFIFISSLFVWTIEACVFSILSLGFSLNLSLFKSIFIMIIIGTGSILPTAPGYVGTVEFLGVTSLSILGVDKTHAFGYIITLHSIQILTIAFWGTIGIIKEKINLSDLIRIEK